MTDKITPTTASAVFSDLAATVTDIAPNAIVSRTIYKDDSVRLIVFGFAPGEELSEHTSKFPAILHFLAGTATVTLGDETIAAEAGAWVHMPGHLPHSVHAETEVKMALYLLTGG